MGTCRERSIWHQPVNKLQPVLRTTDALRALVGACCWCRLAELCRMGIARYTIPARRPGLARHDMALRGLCASFLSVVSLRTKTASQCLLSSFYFRFRQIMGDNADGRIQSETFRPSPKTIAAPSGRKRKSSMALRRLLGRPLAARRPNTPLMHARVGFSMWTSGIF